MFNNINSNYFWWLSPSQNHCLDVHLIPDTHFFCEFFFIETEKEARVMDAESGQLFIDDVSLVAHFKELTLVPWRSRSAFVGFLIWYLQRWNRKSDKVSRFLVADCPISRFETHYLDDPQHWRMKTARHKRRKTWFVFFAVLSWT